MPLFVGKNTGIRRVSGRGRPTYTGTYQNMCEGGRTFSSDHSEG